MATVSLATSEQRGEAVPDPPTRSRRAPVAAMLVVLAAAAAAWAAAVSVMAFPYLGVDHDEAVYLLQADTFRTGRLFPPAPVDPDVARSMLPWLTAHRGDAYVPKYSPAWPSVLAVAREATGSYHTALALVAAGVVVVTYLLALELLRERVTALVAAAFVVLSPFFLLQSPTFLAYLPNVLLLETFALAFARGARTGSRVALGGAGLALGLAFFTRQFDALVFALPFGVWLVLSRRRDLRRLAADVGVLALGAAPGLVTTMAFFRVATGSPLRSPFLLDEHDTIGFGPRRMLPEDPLVEFGGAEALYGMTRHWVLLSFWCFGGLVLMALAVAALRRRSSPLEPWFALVAVVVPAAYALFWGTYMVARWEGPWRIGPYYYLPVLVPLAVLGAKGFVRFWRWDQALAALALVGMVAVSGSVVARALGYQLGRTDELRRLHAPLAGVGSQPAVVFLPADQLLLPYTRARNPSLDQPVLWAVDRGTPHNVEVLDAFPRRTPFLAEGGSTPELRPMTRMRGDRLGLLVEADVRDRSVPAAVEIVWRGERSTVPVGGRADVPFVLTTAGVEGLAPEATREAVSPAVDVLFVRLLVGGEELAAGAVSVGVTGTTLELLVPADRRVETELLDLFAAAGAVG